MSVSIDWQVESLRIAVFPEKNASISPSELWDQYIGVEPDETHIQRGRVNVREVEYKNGRIVLIKRPDRIEWRYLAKQDEDTDTFGFPIIGSLEEEIDVIIEFSKKLLETSDILPINRLVFGAVLLNPEESLLAAYRNLQEFLPFLNTANLYDFDYRVQRWRNSTVVNDLPINRGTWWTVVSLERSDFTLEPQTDPELISTGLEFASRLVLDIDTSQERISSLPSEDLVKLFDELVQLGLELSEEGDKEQ